MWFRRCLIIAPVLGYVLVLSLLLPSCGSSNTSSTAPVSTSTPITLIVMRVCSQPPSTSAACIQPASAQIPGPGTPSASPTPTQFFAQGEFSSNGVSSFQDVSSSATWFVNNSLLTNTGGGAFVAGAAAGCSCITAASGTVISQPVLIGVNQSPTLCSPCPASP